MSNLLTLDDCELEYPIIYGISTPLRHLKLGYELDCNPDFMVQYNADIESYSASSVHSSFRITFLDDNSEWLVVKNKGSKSLFYPKYKKVDYLLCSISEDEVNPEIVKIFNQLKGISICFALDKPNQKDIVNFSQLQ